MTSFANLFTRPLNDWNNPDLLLADARREELEQSNPWAVDMFDWYELRSVFIKHDVEANFYRKIVRWQGRLAIGFAVAGLVLAAFLPLLTAETPFILKYLGAAASVLAVLGGLIGFEHLFFGKAKRLWLVERLWAERLRQLYFQVILRNLERLTSLTDPISMEDWHILRVRDLDWFQNEYMKDPDQILRKTELDTLDEETWLRSQPDFNMQCSSFGPRLRDIYNFFQTQRLNIQEAYVREKIATDPLSPNKLSAAISMLANGLAALVIAIAIYVGIQFWLTPDPNSSMLVWGLALEAIGCALLAGVRVLDEGLRYSEEKDLYSWYTAMLIKLHRRFDTANDQEKLQILFDLEQASYEEFRRFFIAHRRASFLL